MSWDQGIQERETLPPKFIAWAEKKAAENDINGQLEYITWFESDPNRFICDFGDAGSITLRIKAA